MAVLPDAVIPHPSCHRLGKLQAQFSAPEHLIVQLRRPRQRGLVGEVDEGFALGLASGLVNPRLSIRPLLKVELFCL